MPAYIRNLGQLRIYVLVLINRLEKEFFDFPAVFFPTSAGMGIYSVNVLMPAESESACALARLWFEQKGAAILKMRQPNKVAQRGPAGGITIVDKLDYRKFILRGESAAEAYLTKRTKWIDRVRHRDPSNGYAEAILWYPNAAKTTHKRPRAA